LEAYLRLQNQWPDRKIALVGESAGGGLCFALTCKLRELGLDLPSCIVAMSPWTDLTCTSSTFVMESDLDPCLSADMLRQSARVYAGENSVTSPLISPEFANLSGFPPVLLFAGGSEMLLDDSRNIAARLSKFHIPCELHIADDMWHAYVVFPTPESKKAHELIANFLTLHLEADQ
jgi:acetyl esterase/lipase